MADLKKKKRKVTFTEEAPVKSKKKKSVKVIKEHESEKEEPALEEEPTKSGKERKHKRNKSKKQKRATIEDLSEPKVETVFFDETVKKQFSDFELDERILKGIGLLGWERPTEVQLSMIDLVLEGRNVMARARTGSGKTAAFVLPILHRVIQGASARKDVNGPLAVFIAPSKELATQIHKLLSHLLQPLPFISLLNLSELSEAERSVWEHDKPDLVVTTPAKLAIMLKLRSSFLADVRYVVLDEADLLLSFGYDDEMKLIRPSLPPHYQCILTSATLTDDMSTLKKMYMPGPAVTIKLKEGDLPSTSQLTQYQLLCENDEQRFAILLAIIKLKLIAGKGIIFVNSIDRCYKLSIFLSAFKIRSCILNAAMPTNSRCHVINEFNKGAFPFVVASDAADVDGGAVPAEEEEEEGEHKEGEKKRKRKHKRRMDKESGVARGIDFHQVSNVINFDFPTTVEAYIHRVGRTARGFQKGTALSFCDSKERPYLDTIKEEISKQLGEDVLSPYEIRIKELDSFVLRAREALSACTKVVIREARLEEIRQEALRSAKLRAYFAKNPRERDLLENDQKLHTLALHSPAIGDVPDYIVPKALRGLDFSTEERKRKGQKGHHKRLSANQKKYAKKQADPLFAT